ncbi:MAG: hypothetical protein LBS16_05445 [Prevotellaceae bacterium]|nr:hypothetical protein [Prevotellaceae bacterium]
MKKSNLFLFAAFVAAFLSVANYAAAQVTIGGSDAPKAGAILDLNSSVKGGLQLSNVSITDLGRIPVGFPGINSSGDVTGEVKAKLTGAIVYNTYEGLQIASQDAGVAKFGKGIYVWDGNQWNKIGKPEQQAVTFAPYNLGANPAYDTPKKQIEYLASCAYLETDSTVWGAHYQWGRIGDGHQKRHVSAVSGQATASEIDAATGQVLKTVTAKYGHFLSGAEYNWYGGTTPLLDVLWGNGEGLVGQTDNQGGVLHTDGLYYQNTDWTIPANNPCASMGAGWRVPTQDEIERLRNYDGHPGTEASMVSISATGTSISTSYSAPLTWVPVAGGKASDNWVIGSSGNLGGYAIYKTSDWTAAIGAGGYFDDNGTTDYSRPLYAATAPEPLLFLPAAGFSDRLTGTTNYGNVGLYWSCIYPVNSARALVFTSNSVHATSDNRSAHGFSVRCVKSN